MSAIDKKTKHVKIGKKEIIPEAMDKEPLVGGDPTTWGPVIYLQDVTNTPAAQIKAQVDTAPPVSTLPKSDRTEIASMSSDETRIKEEDAYTKKTITLEPPEVEVTRCIENETFGSDESSVPRPMTDAAAGSINSDASKKTTFAKHTFLIVGVVALLAFILF